MTSTISPKDFLLDNRRFVATLLIYYESETRKLLEDLIQSSDLASLVTAAIPTSAVPDTENSSHSDSTEAIARVFLSFFISLIHDIDLKPEGALVSISQTTTTQECIDAATDTYGFVSLCQNLIAELHSEILKSATEYQNKLLHGFDPLVKRVKSMAKEVHEYIARKIRATTETINFKSDETFDQACDRIEQIYCMMSGVTQSAEIYNTDQEDKTAHWNWVRTQPISVASLLHRLAANLSLASYARAFNYLVVMNNLAELRNMDRLRHQKALIFEPGITPNQVRASVLSISEHYPWLFVQEFGNRSVSNQVASTLESVNSEAQHFFHISSDAYGVYLVMDALLAMRFESLQVLEYLKQRRFMKSMSYAPVLLRFFVSYSERALELAHGTKKWREEFTEDDRNVLRANDDATMQFYTFIGALTNFIDMDRYVGRPDVLDRTKSAELEAQTISKFGLRYGMFTPRDADLFMRYRYLYRLTDRIYEAGRLFDANTPASEVYEVVGAVAGFLLMKQPRYISLRILEKIAKYFQSLEDDDPQRLAQLESLHSDIIGYLNAKSHYAFKPETYYAKYMPVVKRKGDKMKRRMWDCMTTNMIFNGAGRIRIEDVDNVYVRLDSHGINHNHHPFLYEESVVTFGAKATAEEADDIECEEASVASSQQNQPSDSGSVQSASSFLNGGIMDEDVQSCLSSAAGSAQSEVASNHSQNSSASSASKRRNKNHLYTRRSHALVINWHLYQLAFSPLIPANLAADILIGMKTRLPENGYETGGFKLKANSVRSNTDDNPVVPPSERGSKRPLTYITTNTDNERVDGILKKYSGGGSTARHGSMPLLAVHHREDTKTTAGIAQLSCEVERRYDFLSMFSVANSKTPTTTDHTSANASNATNLGKFLIQLEWRTYDSICGTNVAEKKKASRKDDKGPTQTIAVAAETENFEASQEKKTRKRRRGLCPWSFNVPLFLSDHTLLNSALSVEVDFQRNVIPPRKKPVFQFNMYYQGCSFLIRTHTKSNKSISLQHQQKSEKTNEIGQSFIKAIYPLVQRAELCVDLPNLWKKIAYELTRQQQPRSRNSFILDDQLRQLCATHLGEGSDGTYQSSENNVMSAEILHTYKHPDLELYVSQRIVAKQASVGSSGTSTSTNSLETQSYEEEEDEDGIQQAGSDIE